MEYYILSEKRVPVSASADIVVVGGGPAGVGAALSAAKQGGAVLLIERFGSCGGIITNGFMSITGRPRGELVKEMFDRLGENGYITNITERYPQIYSSTLTHYGNPNFGRPKDAKHGTHFAFDPYMLSFVMQEMLSEHGVEIMLRTQLTDVVVENNKINAVIVENASGTQAIEGKIFIDATGRGDVIARSGAPFMHAGEGKMLPMPCGLMWKMIDVDVDRVFEYEKEDPGLSNVTRKAIEDGKLPYYRDEKEYSERKYEDRMYTGHMRLEMAPACYPGEILLWAPSVYELGLDCAENANDLTFAEIRIRREIVSEFEFLKRYVPGFEKARMGGIAPFLGIREGRRTIGEYMLTYDDIINNKRFDDAALRWTNEIVPHEVPGSAPVKYVVEYPYRCFQAKNVDNLLVGGDLVSLEHPVFVYHRNFVTATVFGEVAGTAAGLAIKNNTEPKQIKMNPIVME